MKGDVMKPYYSIRELADILHDSIHKVADGLVACGMIPIYEGKPADLSQWGTATTYSHRDDEEGEINYYTGPCLVPHPSFVLIAIDKLPQLWKDRISATEQEKPLTQNDNTAQPEIVAAKVEAGTSTSQSGDDWRVKARQIGKEIYGNKTSLNMDKIAEKTHKEMTDRHSKKEPGMTGRGGKVPTADTIKRHALTGIKS